ncbi:MAG: ATP synthase F0 subunit B [Deltaproteobacteria bacterium]|nr:ATP synthase F0 subunit B [Deltaproteobacteria bacterium]
MISLDSSVVYQVVLFIGLWFVLSKVLFRPYLKLLDERESKTAGALHDTADLEREGARLKAQYEERIAQAQAAGGAAKEAILQEARQRREQVLSQARQEAAATLELARREVASQVAGERQLAAAEAATVARQMASKILGRNLA